MANAGTVEPPSRELWERLRAFDPFCSITMSRTPAPDPIHWGSPRIWWVSIRPRTIVGVRLGEHAEGQHASLAEAIRLAVDRAEPRGWAKGEHVPAAV